MKTRFIDEKTGIPYALADDYYLPHNDSENKSIGAWGPRRKQYLKEHRKGLYAKLLASGKLNGHFAEIGQQAREMFARWAEAMANSEGVTEKLNAASQMEWVGRMNNIRERARKIVSNDLMLA